VQWIYIGLVIRAKLSGFTWCTPVFLFSLPGMPARRLYVLLLLISSFLSISLWLIISGFTTNFQKFSPNGRNLIADNQSHLFSNDSRDVAIATDFGRKSDTTPSFVALTFGSRLEYRNADGDGRIDSVYYLSTSLGGDTAMSGWLYTLGFWRRMEYDHEL